MTQATRRQRATMFPPKLLEAVLASSLADRDSEIHGLAHWERVAAIGRDLVEEVDGADWEVVRLFALFHDAARKNDGSDWNHGLRGAKLADSLRHRLRLKGAQFDKLQYACREHSFGFVSDDPTIGVCWDADRLDLARVGVRPFARLLSTDAARRRKLKGAHPGATSSTRMVYRGTCASLSRRIRHEGIPPGPWREVIYVTTTPEQAHRYAVRWTAWMHVFKQTRQRDPVGLVVAIEAPVDRLSASDLMVIPGDHEILLLADGARPHEIVGLERVPLPELGDPFEREFHALACPANARAFFNMSADNLPPLTMHGLRLQGEVFHLMQRRRRGAPLPPVEELHELNVALYAEARRREAKVHPEGEG